MGNQEQARNHEHIKYQDCMLGKVGAPTESKQRTVFQTIMIFIMVHIMVTFNWFVHTEQYSWEAYRESLYQYPLALIIALAVRFVIANPLIDEFVKFDINPYIKGLPKLATITLVNVLFMGTITAFISEAVVSGGLENFSWDAYLFALPISYAASFTFSFFIVGPLVKKFFREHIQQHVLSHSNHYPALA